MPRRPHRICALLLLLVVATTAAFGSAYNARPKLIVIIIIDQFRGDYLERAREQLGEGGFRLFLDRGAYFTDCNYDYANTRTAPGHATLATGAYTNGHGILANEWWDPVKKRVVTAVQDDATKLIGIAGAGSGSSPRNLLASTLGDELKLATQGKARVYGIALKDRAAIMSTGWAADGAYWIDASSGAWISSTYYAAALPSWVQQFNSGRRADKYWNLEWKDSSGKLLRSTAPQKKASGASAGFYDVVGSTPFANDYELEFARELIVNEKLGAGPATDLLVISFSAPDILGHQAGPDSRETQAMVLALDRLLSEFFGFLGRQIGLANIWMAFSSDHGVAPLPADAAKLRLSAPPAEPEQVRKQINAAVSAKLGRAADYVRFVQWPNAYLSEEAFAAARLSEADAERLVGQALQKTGARSYFTRAQLESGDVPQDALGRKYLHSRSPYGGWYVLGVPPIFSVPGKSGTDHVTPYTYDTHVPLAFYGLPFPPGVYRTHAEPVDLATTLASLLGINAPTHATGRVLTEMLGRGSTPAVATGLGIVVPNAGVPAHSISPEAPR
ncbi:MAG: alkaline phosphatase family protein [Terriglobales bacterium]